MLLSGRHTDGNAGHADHGDRGNRCGGPAWEKAGVVGMKLYTSKVVAQWLGLTERRVRQLRDEGVIAEARPGLYDLQPTWPSTSPTSGARAESRPRSGRS